MNVVEANEKTRAEKAQKEYLDKQKEKDGKNVNILPFVIAALGVILILVVIFAVYIASMHKELSLENAQADLQTMSQVGTLDWESTLKDAPWAVVFCSDEEFIVNSSKNYESRNLRNCSYKTATDITIKPVGNIFSTKGKIQFVRPSESE